MQNWIVKEGKEKRVRGKHPWVFANELRACESSPGEAVKLLDAQGEFLAFGYGNPHSTICLFQKKKILAIVLGSSLNSKPLGKNAGVPA
jgi:23S rRNA G2069 N7-methylase RlmK/C1962 C5-methylase RlmI